MKRFVPPQRRATLSRSEQYLEPDVHKLYQLIWNRFIASQMVPAILDVTRVESSPVKTK